MRTISVGLILSLSLAAAEKPRINGPKVFGVRPGHPVLFTIPATGDRPMEFSAKGLPKGLALDARTGRISGVLDKKHVYSVTLRAKNAEGVAERKLDIVAGGTLALTPPMGWSTWYMAHAAISDELVRSNADAMVSSGLINHGYSYINIDDGWNIKPGSTDPAIGGPPRDANGNLRSNRHFPDMKALCDYVHGKGLKIGIYIGPGPLTCGQFEASYQHEEQDARQFAAWGFDFLKYDQCSYSKLIKNKKDVEEYKKPYRLMGSILPKLDRDFVYNLCQYGNGNVWEWGREVGGNFWRTAGDVGGEKKDLWQNVQDYGFAEAGRAKWVGPGGWNDPDNILVGQILRAGKLVPTPLTEDEQYTYVSLWSLLASPLVLGCDLTKLDDFTLRLVTNDEVVDVNQDRLGLQAARVWEGGGQEVWVKPLEDGSLAVGLFNRSELEAAVTAAWSQLSIGGRQTVRDIWSHKDLGVFENQFQSKVPRHGAMLLRIAPEKRHRKP